ncbi:hypothetical protein BG011_001190 [Mortierella polycephala]|uniref:Karyogamy protein n=1 Tax=Mortierella polycephala TaxID=41804 RepID=A0A9P6UAJ9_9FUNG|nr:hypothetical protein BG011_001190 [Mortierella polycephala]
MAAIPARLDGLSEMIELERIPLPYKTLYHTLVFKSEMPVDLLRERHRSGSHQLLTWIQAALDLVETVAQTQKKLKQDDDEEEEEEDEELEAEIQDVVSGFGQYEPTIESSIEILLQLEECIAQRAGPLSTSSISSSNSQDPVHLSAEVESILEQWSRLRGIIGDLSGSVREHQRLRNGIQSTQNIMEQTRQAGEILEKCLRDIKTNRQRAHEWALQDSASRNGSTNSLNSNGKSHPMRTGSQSSSVDSNDMLELDSRIGILALQVDTLQKSYPECTRPSKSRSRRRSIKQQQHQQQQQQQESGSIADKKRYMQALFQELWADWHSLRARKDQLWRDLEECDRWRTSIEKTAKQIETMLEPVEVFRRKCVNMLRSLDESSSTIESSKDDSEITAAKTAAESTDDHSVLQSPISLEAPSKELQVQSDIETLWATLQELDEKQSTIAPAIENMFWVQDGEIHHRNKSTAFSPTAPKITSSNAPVSYFQESTSSPSASSADNSPLYPSLEMLERQRNLKSRWSNLKTSLDAVGARLHSHHSLMKEKANEALHKKEEMAAEDKTLVGSGNSIDGNDWRTSPAARRSSTGDSPKSPTSPVWSSSTRFFRGKLVPSITPDTTTVRKFMLIKSEKPTWTKPRPWCPSVSTSSPSMPGFPLQTSSWGHFLLSPNADGIMVATPAPLAPRSPTPAPSAATLSVPKDTRPPFSPGGNRRYTAFNKPAPTRSLSVASGEFKNMIPAGPESGGVVDWTKTLRRSTSIPLKQTSPKDGNPKARPLSTMSGSRILGAGSNGRESRQGPGGLATMPSLRRNSSVSQQGRGNVWNSHNSANSNRSQGQRRPSMSSSEDETVMGHPSRQKGSNANKGVSRRRSFFSNGLAPLTTLSDSNSSLDSMLSPSDSCYSDRRAYESSITSSIGARSPSPYTPMFGSSFAAARSTAALHSALMASMSSTSSASLRYSSSSLSGSDTKKHHQQHQQKKRQQQIMRMGATSASSWMSMNTDSLLSALSFTVPAYNFDDDFSSLGSMEETVAAM